MLCLEEPPESARDSKSSRLLFEIREIYTNGPATYGSRRVHAELKSRSLVCYRGSIACLVNAHSILARFRRKFIFTSNFCHIQPVTSNVLERKVFVERADTVWALEYGLPAISPSRHLLWR